MHTKGNNHWYDNYLDCGIQFTEFPYVKISDYILSIYLIFICHLKQNLKKKLEKSISLKLNVSVDVAVSIEHTCKINMKK
jgi:hypothetical protein